MGFIFNGTRKTFYFGILALFLIGAQEANSKGNASHLFPEPPRIPTIEGVDIRVTDSVLPANLNFESPSFILPYTTPVIIRVTRDDGSVVPDGTIVNLFVDGLRHGAITKLDDPETEDDPTTPQIENNEFLQLTGTNFEETVGGMVQFFFTSLSVPGVATLTASVQDPETGRTVIASAQINVESPISGGDVFSLTFTGPFANAVNENANNLDFDLPPANGTYNRLVSVIATDRFGNVVPPGTQVRFRLIDAPLTGFPEQGRGTFTIAGKDGNPQEGGIIFTTPEDGTSLAGTGRFDTLVLAVDGSVLPRSVADIEERLLPDQIGFRTVISSINSPHELIIGEPAFNLRPDFHHPDSGFTVPFTIGRPLHGNIESPRFTDENGVATTRFNYPATQLGRRVILVAETDVIDDNGEIITVRTVGAVMDAKYLGVADGSQLAIISPPPPEPAEPSPVRVVPNKTLTFEGPSGEQTIILELRSGCPDLDRDGFFCENPVRGGGSVADLLEPLLRDPMPGEVIEIRRKITGFAGIAEFESGQLVSGDENVGVLVTDGNGRITVTLKVSNLSPGSSVNFDFAPVEVPSNKVTVTFMVPPPPEPEPAPAPAPAP